MNKLCINGYARSGKTFFSEWLAENHGYTHIDLENKASCLEHGVEPLYCPYAFSLNSVKLRQSFENLSRIEHCVVSWACHPIMAFLPCLLRNEGFTPIWFNSPSRESAFNDLVTSCFEISFEPIYEKRIIETREADCWRDCNEIYSEMMRFITSDQAH